MGASEERIVQLEQENKELQDEIIRLQKEKQKVYNDGVIKLGISKTECEDLNEIIKDKNKQIKDLKFNLCKHQALFDLKNILNQKLSNPVKQDIIYLWDDSGPLPLQSLIDTRKLKLEEGCPVEKIKILYEGWWYG